MGINSQVDLARVTRAASANGFRLTAGSAGTILVSLGVGPNDEHSLEIGLFNQSVEYPEPFAVADQALKRCRTEFQHPKGQGISRYGQLHKYRQRVVFFTRVDRPSKRPWRGGFV